MRLLRSALLDGAGARHGFSTRLGGVSEGRHASLNLGRSWGDDPAHVDENRRRLAADGGFDLAALATVKQVHGARCVVADGRGPSEIALEQADALVASEPGRAVAVFTADCVPILFSDGEGRVAAAHAGWRGTVANVVSATVDALVALGARRDRIVAAIGPSIGPCCFEVGEEVAAEFAALFAPSGPDRRPGDGDEGPRVVRRDLGRTPGARPHVDLRLANRLLLARAGVASVEGGAPRVDEVASCTMCERERFFSFRRDGAGIGQMLSFAVAGRPRHL